jgi:hypothetical protein
MSRQQNEELLKIGGSVLKSLKLADYEATGRATGMDLEKVLKQVREPPSTAMLPCVTPPGPLTWPHGPQELWAAGMQKPDDELSELKFQALKRTLTIDECADATDDEEARTLLRDNTAATATSGQCLRTGSFHYAAFVVGLVKHLSDEKMALLKRNRVVK